MLILDLKILEFHIRVVYLTELLSSSKIMLNAISGEGKNKIEPKWESSFDQLLVISMYNFDIG